MLRAITTPRLGCEFDRFLYASVGDDNNGVPLTGLDPIRIAAPLIALSPCPRDRVPPLLKTFAKAAPTKHPALVSTLLTVVTYLIFTLTQRAVK
jgi:hypothetical protein